jgi:hypothetical protein
MCQNVRYLRPMPQYILSMCQNVRYFCSLPQNCLKECQVFPPNAATYSYRMSGISTQCGNIFLQCTIMSGISAHCRKIFLQNVRYFRPMPQYILSMCQNVRYFRSLPQNILTECQVFPPIAAKYSYNGSDCQVLFQSQSQCQKYLLPQP